jgi:TRAP-type C4-dicarboxylate transport system permease small subunit
MAIVRWFDANIEKIIIIISYITMAAIIFVEVIRRFLLNQQEPWSSTIPILLFLWVTWIGAAYNVKIRTHLSFDELRMRLPYNLQFCCLILDAFLWIAFACIVLYFSIQQVQLSHDNFAIVTGTDDIMQWWFYMATPVAWALLCIRVLQNLRSDYLKWRSGQKFSISVSMLGE